MEDTGQAHQIHHPIGGPIALTAAHAEARRVAGVAAALVITGLVILWLAAFHGNVLGFYRIGDYRPAAPALAGQAAVVFPHQAGYDGQYYLALALDPLLHKPGTLAALDYPRYRCRRMFVPILGHVLGLGQPALIPYVLPLINAGALVWLVWLIARWLQAGGRSGWGGLLALSVLGVWEVLALTTTDLVSSVLFIAALYMLRQERPAVAMCALALAALTREVMLLYWIMLLGALLIARHWRSLGWLVWAGWPAVAWNYYVLRHMPLGAGGHVVQILFGAPGTGWGDKIQQLIAGGLTGRNLYESLVFLSFLAALTVLLWNIWRLRAQREIWPAAAIALLLGAMFLCAKFFLLNYYLDYSRVFQDLFLLLVLSLGFSAAARPSTYVVLSVAGISAAIFLLHYTCGAV